MHAYNVNRPDVSIDDLEIITKHFIRFLHLVPVGIGAYRERLTETGRHLKVERHVKARLLAERGGRCAACGNTLPIDQSIAHHLDYNDTEDLNKVALVHEHCHGIIHAIAGILLMWFPAEMGLATDSSKRALRRTRDGRVVAQLRLGEDPE
jgi:hypothetical protein